MRSGPARRRSTEILRSSKPRRGSRRREAFPATAIRSPMKSPNSRSVYGVLIPLQRAASAIAAYPDLRSCSELPGSDRSSFRSRAMIAADGPFATATVKNPMKCRAGLSSPSIRPGRQPLSPIISADGLSSSRSVPPGRSGSGISPSLMLLSSRAIESIKPFQSRSLAIQYPQRAPKRRSKAVGPVGATRPAVERKDRSVGRRPSGSLRLVGVLLA